MNALRQTDSQLLHSRRDRMISAPFAALPAARNHRGWHEVPHLQLVRSLRILIGRPPAFPWIARDRPTRLLECKHPFLVPFLLCANIALEKRIFALATIVFALITLLRPILKKFLNWKLKFMHSRQATRNMDRKRLNRSERSPGPTLRDRIIGNQIRRPPRQQVVRLSAIDRDLNKYFKKLSQISYVDRASRSNKFVK